MRTFFNIIRLFLFTILDFSLNKNNKNPFGFKKKNANITINKVRNDKQICNILRFICGFIDKVLIFLLYSRRATCFYAFKNEPFLFKSMIYIIKF